MEYQFQGHQYGGTSGHQDGDGYTGYTETQTYGQDSYQDQAGTQGVESFTPDQGEAQEEPQIEAQAEVEGESDSPYSEPIPVPPNSRNDAIFSEKDIYRVLNLVIALESRPESTARLVDLVLSIGGNNVRRSITLVKMESADFEDKTAVVEVLAAIGEMTKGNVDNPIQAVLETVSRVSGLDEAQKTSMVSLARRLVRENGGTQRIRSPKSASDVEIVQDIQAAMTGENPIAESVSDLGNTIAALAEAAK